MKNYVFRGYGKEIASDELKKPFNIKRDISVIIPTYNEAENIEKIIFAIEKNLKKTKFKDSYEILVIDDNSTDKTAQIIDTLAKKGNFIAVHRYGKRGLFSAVNDGIFIANGAYVLTMDADFSHPPILIPQMVGNLEQYDVIIASRYTPGGGMNGPTVRVYGSRLLNRLCIFIAGLDVSDFGGQFRLFKKNKYLQIRFKYPSNFAEYGIELFFRAKKLKFRIKEIPFVYNFREQGTSKMGNVTKLPLLGLRYLRTAIMIRFEKLFGLGG